MIYALANVLLVFMGLALFFFAPDPAELFDFLSAEQAHLTFLILLAGLFALAAWLNAQRYETPGRFLTSWITNSTAIVLVGLQLLGSIKVLILDRGLDVKISKTKINKPGQSRSKPRSQSKSPLQDDKYDTVRSYGSVEIKAAKNGNFYTDATINGNSVKITIDTGATYISLPYEVAEAMALDPLNLEYNKKMRTANGISLAAMVELDEVTVAGITVNNVKAVVHKPGALRKRALLGMSYLSRIDSFKISGDTLILGE